MKNIIITGSTRGIGLALAVEFLRLDCNLAISGRSQGSVDTAVKFLSANPSSGKVIGYTCDARSPEALQGLWDAAAREFGSIDIWINNAGVATCETPAWDYTPEQINAVVDTNVKGAILGTGVALRGMLAQGNGAVYNLEGLGSDKGPHITGQSLYATTKAALRYFDDSLAMELKGTAVISAAILPGMVLTDMLLSDYRDDPVKLKKVRFIYNVLAEMPETVAPVLVKKILANKKNGARIRFASPASTFLRFLLAPFRKRDVVSQALNTK